MAALFDMYGKKVEPSPLMLAQLDQAAPQDDMMSLDDVPISAAAPAPRVSTKSKIQVSAPAYSLNNDLVDATEAGYLKNLEDRKAALETLRKKLGDEEGKKPTGFEAMNLKPLAAFVDSITGSRLAQSVDEPTAPKEWQAKYNRLQDIVGKQSNELNDDELNLLKLKMQERIYGAREQALARNQDKTQRAGEFRLREKWESNPVTKASQSMDDHYRRITGVDANTPAGQMSMVFAYMKMLDDGSVVRESEYAQAARTAGLYDRAAQYAKSLQDGKTLTPQQINEFRSSAESIMNEVRQKQGQLDEQYKKMAEDYDFSPNRVVYGVSFKKPQGAPSPGDVVDGHKFKGGNPADPNSWEQVK